MPYSFPPRFSDYHHSPVYFHGVNLFLIFYLSLSRDSNYPCCVYISISIAGGIFFVKIPRIPWVWFTLGRFTRPQDKLHSTVPLDSKIYSSPPRGGGLSTRDPCYPIKLPVDCALRLSGTRDFGNSGAPFNFRSGETFTAGVLVSATFDRQRAKVGPENIPGMVNKLERRYMEFYTVSRVRVAFHHRASSRL